MLQSQTHGACLASDLTVDRSEQDEGSALRMGTLVVREVEAPLALCSPTGMLESATPVALALLRNLGVVSEVPSALPSALWCRLEQVAMGEAVEWQPPHATGQLLGCTRYIVQHVGFLLLMREVSEKQAALSEELHRQRSASMGRLMACVAHDVRSSVASIVYSADFLDARGADVTPQILRDTVHEICDASRRLQLTVDGLLDYARLGPAISVPVSLREALNRAQGMLRSFYRTGAHRLRIELRPQAEWVRGNPVVVEQIFVNLLLTIAERADCPQTVTVRSYVDTELEQARRGTHALIQVLDGASDDEGLTVRSAAPQLHTESASLCLAFTDAQAAALSQGGDLSFEMTSAGSRFSVRLPRSEGPR